MNCDVVRIRHIHGRVPLASGVREEIVAAVLERDTIIFGLAQYPFIVEDLQIVYMLLLDLSSTLSSGPRVMQLTSVCFKHQSKLSNASCASCWRIMPFDGLSSLSCNSSSVSAERRVKFTSISKVVTADLNWIHRKRRAVSKVPYFEWKYDTQISSYDHCQIHQSPYEVYEHRSSAIFWCL
jgi:hypothetical protein